MFDRVHHVAYTVSDVEAYRPLFGEVFGLERVDEREMPDAGYRADVYRTGETYVEVQEPLGHEEMEAFLDEHGSGLNHVAYEVEDLDAALETLEGRGVERAWDEPIVAPTFPSAELIDMDPETSEGIYLQLVEET